MSLIFCLTVDGTVQGIPLSSALTETYYAELRTAGIDPPPPPFMQVCLTPHTQVFQNIMKL
jgi:hypothetical protein